MKTAKTKVLHFHDTELGRQVIQALAPFKAQFGAGDPYMFYFVRADLDNNPRLLPTLEAMTNLLAELGFGFCGDGGDARYYVYRLFPLFTYEI